MPSVKSSISSRARFSLGCPLRLAGASSQTRRAGSRAIAPSSSPNGFRANRRQVSFCRRIRARVADLLDAGGEVVVPHQGQALAQRVGREDKAVEPPRLEAARVAGCGRGLAEHGGRPLEFLGLGRPGRVDTFPRVDESRWHRAHRRGRAGARPSPRRTPRGDAGARRARDSRRLGRGLVAVPDVRRALIGLRHDGPLPLVERSVGFAGNDGDHVARFAVLAGLERRDLRALERR